MSIKKVGYFVFFILLSQLAGILGSIFTISSVTSWYLTLAKPWFTPPSWVFGPVWITLYTLIGISIFLIWLKKPQSKFPYQIFATQLFLNTIWSIIFFGQQAVFLAFIEIILLWGIILTMIISYWKISKPASLILVPYLVWVTIASALNLFIFILN